MARRSTIADYAGLPIDLPDLRLQPVVPSAPVLDAFKASELILIRLSRYCAQAGLEEIRMPDPILVSIADLRAVCGHVSTRQRADNGGVVNGITGTVGGNFLQARDIGGGVSF